MRSRERGLGPKETREVRTKSFAATQWSLVIAAKVMGSKLLQRKKNEDNTFESFYWEREKKGCQQEGALWLERVPALFEQGLGHVSL